MKEGFSWGRSSDAQTRWAELPGRYRFLVHILDARQRLAAGDADVNTVVPGRALDVSSNTPLADHHVIPVQAGAAGDSLHSRVPIPMPYTPETLDEEERKWKAFISQAEQQEVADVQARHLMLSNQVAQINDELHGLLVQRMMTFSSGG